MMSRGGESHTRHRHCKYLVPWLQSACTRLLQLGHMTMSPKSFSPQHPQEGSLDVMAKNNDTVAGIMSAGLAGGGAAFPSRSAERKC